MYHSTREDVFVFNVEPRGCKQMKCVLKLVNYLVFLRSVYEHRFDVIRKDRIFFDIKVRCLLLVLRQ